MIGELEHLKTKTRLIDEKFSSGLCVLEVIGVPSIIRLTRKTDVLVSVMKTFSLSLLFIIIEKA